MIFTTLIAAGLAEAAGGRSRARTQELRGRLGLNAPSRVTGLRGVLQRALKRLQAAHPPQVTRIALAGGTYAVSHLFPSGSMADHELHRITTVITMETIGAGGHIGAEETDRRIIAAVAEELPHVSRQPVDSEYLSEWLFRAIAEQAQRILSGEVPPDHHWDAAGGGTYVITSRAIRRVRDWQGATEADLSDYTWPEAVRASDEWHGGAHVDAGSPIPDAVPLIRYKDGYSLQRLITRKQFADEGNSMVHCVGGGQGGDGDSDYYKASRDGGSVLLSVRDPYGKPLATGEVQIGENFIELVQVYGPYDQHLKVGTPEHAIFLGLATDIRSLDRGSVDGDVLDSLGVSDLLTREDVESLESLESDLFESDQMTIVEDRDNTVALEVDQLDGSPESVEILVDAIHDANEARQKLLHDGYESILYEYRNIPNIDRAVMMALPRLTAPVVDPDDFDVYIPELLVGFQFQVDGEDPKSEESHYIEGELKLHLGEDEPEVDYKVSGPGYDSRECDRAHRSIWSAMQEEALDPPSDEDFTDELRQFAPRWVDDITNQRSTGEAKDHRVKYLAGPKNTISAIDDDLSPLYRLMMMPTPEFLKVLGLRVKKGRIFEIR